jgi:hypothetical protein
MHQGRLTPVEGQNLIEEEVSELVLEGAEQNLAFLDFIEAVAKSADLALDESNFGARLVLDHPEDQRDRLREETTVVFFQTLQHLDPERVVHQSLRLAYYLFSIVVLQLLILKEVKLDELRHSLYFLHELRIWLVASVLVLNCELFNIYKDLETVVDYFISILVPVEVIRLEFGLIDLRNIHLFLLADHLEILLLYFGSQK